MSTREIDIDELFPSLDSDNSATEDVDLDSAGSDDTPVFDDEESEFHFEDDDKKEDDDEEEEEDDDEEEEDEEDEDGEECDEATKVELLADLTDVKDANGQPLVSMEEVRNYAPHLENKVVKVKQTKEGRLAGLRKQTALNMARKAGHPLYKKYATHRKLSIEARDQIYKQFGSKADKVAKQLLAGLKGGKTIKLKD